jgi:Ser/Thr protein kinase RdoA (MazF antagonist)
LAFDSLAASTVAAWGLEPTALERIACRENAVYAVQIAGGRRFALRVHRHGYHDRAALNSEVAWMQALTTAGVTAPTVVKTATGEAVVEVRSEQVPVPHLCDLLEWVDGRPLGSADRPEAMRHGGLEDTYRTVGRIAAQIHNHSTTWQQPPGFARPSWDREGCLGRAALWGPWFDLEALQHDERGILDAAVAVVDPTLERLGLGRDVYGLVHADFVPDNLFEHDGRVVVIDFDDSGYGWYLWELVTAVFWYLGTPQYTQALNGYVSGYRAVRALPESELQLVPQFLFLRALVYLGWMQTRRTQATARRMTTRVRELSRALAARVLAGNMEYQQIPLELTPLPGEGPSR